MSPAAAWFAASVGLFAGAVLSYLAAILSAVRDIRDELRQGYRG